MESGQLGMNWYMKKTPVFDVRKKHKLANSYLYIRLELATCPGCTSSAHRCSRPPGRCPRGALTDHKWIVVSPWENSGSWVACFFFIQEKQSFLCGFLLVLLLILNDFFAEIPRQADLSLFFFFFNFQKVMFSTLFCMNLMDCPFEFHWLACAGFQVAVFP